jgi:hypothetical protein
MNASTTNIAGNISDQTGENGKNTGELTKRIGKMKSALKGKSAG